MSYYVSKHNETILYMGVAFVTKCIMTGQKPKQLKLLGTKPFAYVATYVVLSY